MNKKTGFTLIELLLTLAVIALLGALSAPYFMTFHISSQSNTTTQEIVQSLRRAKIRAIASENDDNWGLALKDQKITLFKGSAYSSRDSSFDEAFDLPPSITASGINEIYFLKSSGNPSTSGTIILVDTNSKQRNISVNTKGTIDY